MGNIKKKTVIVTGGAGFIGSALIGYLLKTGTYRVVNLDKLTYAAVPGALDGLKNNNDYYFIHGDICDARLINNMLIEFKPEGIINLAAESHVDRSIDSPDPFITTNIIGTHTLLKTSLEYIKDLKKMDREKFCFHHVSTDEVYGELGDNGYFTEESKYMPSSPYSASKASSDHIVRAYYKTYNLPVVITNCSNNYGPYQFPEKLIPLMIIKALNGQPLPIYGNGMNVRDWLYVDDHAIALETVFSRGKPGETYNIGGGEERKNCQVVETICDILDDKIGLLKTGKCRRTLMTYVNDRPGHDYRYAIDYSKIQSQLNWRPSVSFYQGLEQTIDWYLANSYWWLTVLRDRYQGERLGNAMAQPGRG